MVRRGRLTISIFELTALLLTLAAIFGWLNIRFIHMSQAVALLIMGLVVSLLLVGIETVLPGQGFAKRLSNGLSKINFTQVVMNGMLAFLLFAGAMNVDLDRLRSRAWQIAFLAFIATVISTALVGFAVWLAAGVLGTPLPLAWALVFGALISPTDPIAVLATLKNIAVPESLEAEMQGEALFNDGVGVVLFSLLLSYALGLENEPVTLPDVVGHLLRESLGGIVLGMVTGFLAYRAIRAIDDFSVEVLITIALVMSTYGLAGLLGVSGPLSVVAAGLLVGYRAPRYAMSERSRNYVAALWTLVDEVLNSVLFLLIGLEVLVINFDAGTLPLALLAVPLVLLARAVAVGLPLAFDWRGRLSPRNVPFLTWAGVHGGISVALVLAIPENRYKATLLATTYAVVLFSIIVQGSTLGLVARKTLKLEHRSRARKKK